MTRDILSGNEAIARGAYEANVWVAAGYPGTPSSEIIETISYQYPDINSEWSVNEKVALEVAIGSAIAGIRSIATMKHVGLNVAADPLMTVAYTGINAGLVVIVADDPGMHSSQNEQDTRNYAKFAKVPLLEPGDSSEAKEYTKLALDISEKFDTLALLRPVTRVSHTKTVVELSEPKRKLPEFTYKKDMSKYVMVPANAIPKHRVVIDRYNKLTDYSNQSPVNKMEMRDKKIGIITHGLIYNYVREALPEVSTFKVGMYPIPLQKIKEFAAQVDKLYVIEELDPIIEEELKINNIQVIGKEIIPLYGELSVELIRNAVNGHTGQNTSKGPVDNPLPNRPPVLCKGCGHIPVFEVLRDMKAIVLGDIGCYTLGALQPYGAMDTTICMGASVGNEIGFKKFTLLTGKKVPSLAVIGDSTFFHSGMTNLLNAVYNRVPITLLILDNHITAMTGHQPNIKTGLDNKFEKSGEIDMERLVRGLGVNRVVKVNAYKKEQVRAVIEEEMNADEPSVILIDEICVIGEARIRKASELKK